jgi:protein phosphatase
MGIERSVMVDVFTHLVRTGDRIVLCSDGLVDEVADADISTVLSQHSDAQETAEALVMVANANGGRDNTTVIVVDILDDISEPVDLPEAETTKEIPVVVAAPASNEKQRKKSVVGVVLFWSVLTAIILSSVTILGVYARSGYFIGFDSSENVAVYRGHPGGFLWFQPTIDTQTELAGDELPEDILRDVALNRTFTSSSQAQKYLSFIKIAIVDANTTTTSTTVAK